MIKIIMYILTITSICKICVNSQIESEENCETLQSEIHIAKDEKDETGGLIRTCSTDILVTKCEGSCNSQVQPSVKTSTGFLKECFCCRESYLKERLILLDHCYDVDGVRLEGEILGTMEIKLREPAECKCTKCGGFSR